jgi:hypothetical protein
MKKILPPALALCISLPGSAQHEADNWYFGNNAAITFSSGTPVALPPSPMTTQEGSASLSDANGDLLFYSDGFMVWGRDHLMMPAGIGLMGSTTCSQSALFTPYPGQDSLFFLFTPPDFLNSGAFSYSMIDLTLNGGFGEHAVVQPQHGEGDRGAPCQQDGCMGHRPCIPQRGFPRLPDHLHGDQHHSGHFHGGHSS